MFEVSSLFNTAGMCLIGFPDKCLVDGIQRVGQNEVDWTEVFIRDFRKFVETNNFVTKAKGRGCPCLRARLEKKIGWNWSSTYGNQSDDAEPAVHVTV